VTLGPMRLREVHADDDVRSRLRAARTQYRQDLCKNFHRFIGLQVAAASPLLIDVCEAWKVDLDTTLRRLRPPKGWPYPSRRKGYPHRAARASGVGSTGDGIIVCLMDDVLDVRVWLGEAFVCTGGGEFQLWLDQRWPETVHDSLAGRPLASVVDHPLLHLRPYTIISSRVVGNGCVIEAEAPNVPYALPWADGD